MKAVRVASAPTMRDERGRPISSLRMNTADLLSTIADSDAKKLLTNFIAIRSGIKVTGAPKAMELAKNADLTARSIFDHYQKRYALSASDLPEIISSVLEKVATPKVNLTHRKILKFVKADNFMEHEFLVSLDNLKVATVPENGVVPVTYPEGFIASMKIETKRIRMPLGRKAVLSGALNVSEFPNLLLRAAYRDEAQATYAALENNPLLSDGAPLFGATNTVTGSSLHDLGAALVTFRNQKSNTDGDELANLEPKFFVVPAASEIAANKEIFNSGLAGKIEVIGSASVTAAYLMADPEEAPVIIKLALLENPMIETKNPDFATDTATILDLFHDYRIGAVTRVGIVKMTM